MPPDECERARKPPEGEPVKHERDAQAERVGDQHLLAPSKGAGARSQPEDGGQDGSIQGVQPKANVMPMTRSRPRAEGRRA